MREGFFFFFFFVHFRMCLAIAASGKANLKQHGSVRVLELGSFVLLVSFVNVSFSLDVSDLPESQFYQKLRCQSFLIAKI